MMNMKILSIYLPGFHEEELNNKAWGKGFTEWDNVKTGKKLYKDHVQPIVPLNGNYYDLSKKEDIKRQVKIAKKYKVDGFIFYHYWFGNNKSALTKPAEIFKNEIEEKIDFCFCWANHSWIKNWHGNDSQLIAKQIYGDEKEWLEHINYLLPFFYDKKYIKIDNRPIMYFYNMSDIKCIDDMLKVWNKVLAENGFGNIYVVEYISSRNRKINYEKTDSVVEFEPLYTTFFDISIFNKAKRFLSKKIGFIDFQNYDNIWKKIVKRTRRYNGKTIQKGCFSGWDNSARKGHQCMIVKNNTPEKFGKYLEQLINNDRKDSNNDFIVINAWNEWSEGAILEPTEENGYAYLEEIRKVKDKYEK